MAWLKKEVGLKRSYVNYYKRFQQLSQRPQAKISGLISLTIFTVAFFGMFAILPTFKTIAELNKEIKDTELVNDKLTKKIQVLDQVEEAYADSIKDLKLIDGVLPGEAEFERLAWQLHWLANDRGIVLQGGSFSEFKVLGVQTATGEEVMELETEITINGSYGQIKEFIEDLTRIDRLVKIKEMAIGGKRYRVDSSSLTANIKLSAYYLPKTIETGMEEVGE